MVAPATLGSTHVSIVWDKPVDYREVTGYVVLLDGHQILKTTSKQTHATVVDLQPNTQYTFEVRSLFPQGRIVAATKKIGVKTRPAAQLIDVTQAPYAADPTGKRLSTAALQRAITDCPKGGTVLIPKGTIVLSGAIDLKSDMVFQVDGTLQGSTDPSDYVYAQGDRSKSSQHVNADGLILTRYEGWEMNCFRSLINAGYLTPENRMNMVCHDIRICGTGTIIGGGNQLGDGMKERYHDKQKWPQYVSDGIGGRRVRGRLLSFIQCQNVDIWNVTVKNPPCWTIHMIYCDTVTTHGVNIQSRGIDNGDGWDPDSSRNMMIFDTTFDTGDDCIAIKSGKNPEGNQINILAKNIRIFDLKMIGGHVLAIGSEESGGVDGVSLRDCVVSDTDYGVELKAHASRGGYIRNFKMQDCRVDRFMVHSVDYNADGQAAPTLPVFQTIQISNTQITGNGHSLEFVGFYEPQTGACSDISDVLLDSVTLPNNGNANDPQICVKYARKITFKNVHREDGAAPVIDADMRTIRVLRINGKQSG